MKLRRLTQIALALLAVASAHAQNAAADLDKLVREVRGKIAAGHRTAAELKPEIASFDDLLAKYKDQSADDAAQISLMRAMLFVEVLGDQARGKELLLALKHDFPSTRQASLVDEIVSTLEQRQKTKEAEAAVVGKAAPELHFAWATRDGLKKLSELKGKVVVIDFWATWCGPCIASFPEVRELVEHYKGTDVVILGVTSLQGRVVNLEPTPIDTKGDPQKEISLMPAFIKAKDITWDIAISDEPVFNPEYGIAAIPHMTIIAPDGTVRHNDLHPAAPQAIKTQKIDAILKEFGKELPK